MDFLKLSSICVGTKSKLLTKVLFNYYTVLKMKLRAFGIQFSAASKHESKETTPVEEQLAFHPVWFPHGFQLFCGKLHSNSF